MGTTNDTAEKILIRIQSVADVCIKPMMGEYILYVDKKEAKASLTQ